MLSATEWKCPRRLADAREQSVQLALEIAQRHTRQESAQEGASASAGAGGGAAQSPRDDGAVDKVDEEADLSLAHEVLALRHNTREARVRHAVELANMRRRAIELRSGMRPSYLRTLRCRTRHNGTAMCTTSRTPRWAPTSEVRLGADLPPMPFF